MVAFSVRILAATLIVYLIIVEDYVPVRRSSRRSRPPGSRGTSQR